MILAIASNPNTTIVTDDVYDRDSASDGFSRFGGYIARRLPAIVDDDPYVLSDPVRWASFAWATAALPVMSPGYVEWDNPIEDIQVGWDDGRLVVEVVLRVDCHLNLPGWRGWDRDLRGNLVEPCHGNRIALSRTILRAVLKDIVLPSAPSDHGNRTDVVWRAKAAVRSVAAGIESVLEPVLLPSGPPKHVSTLTGSDTHGTATKASGSGRGLAVPAASSE